MAGMNAVFDPTAVSDTMQTELAVARRRIAELEGELRRWREGAAPAAHASFTEMRLLDVEGLLVKQAMERFRGNVSRAARALGLSRSALYRRLERHKIDDRASAS
jgi:transcriptional regulator of acetoin/glycerol metabolism